MTTHRKDAAERHRYYADLIQRQKTSPLTIAQFCRRNALSVWTFYEWRKRLAADIKKQFGNTGAARFLPVTISEPVQPETVSACCVHVTLPDRTSVQIGAGYPPAGIRAIIDALRGE